jgi:hypothetical protein
VQGYLAALEAYHSSLVEEQRRANLWEQEMVGVVEALAALRQRLEQSVAWEDKRAVVQLLVKGIAIEARTGDDGERYAVCTSPTGSSAPLRWSSQSPLSWSLSSPIQWRQSGKLYDLGYNSVRS